MEMREKNKTKYSITLEEIICQTYGIYANSPQEALELVKRGYCAGSIVIDSGEVHSAKAAVNLNGELKDWVELL